MKKWRTLVEEQKTSEDIRVYMAGIQEVKSYRLCVFGDACKGAYAGAVYLWFTLRIVASKTRVSPSQALTIPRWSYLQHYC